MTLLVSTDELALHLADPTIDVDRATAMLTDAQTLCETIVSPLPAAATIVIKRVAARAYTGSVTTRAPQQLAAGSVVGTGVSMGSGVYLNRWDRADLRRLNGKGAAFSINLIPADYALEIPIYDSAGLIPDIETS